MITLILAQGSPGSGNNIAAIIIAVALGLIAIGLFRKK